jgi:HK97 family phage portal protein
MPTTKRKLSWFQRTAGRFAVRALKYAGIPLRDPALVALFGRQDTFSGMDVDEDTALNCASVWSAISLISSARAMMPCNVYMKDSKEIDTIAADHGVQMLVNVSPNPHMTAYTWAEVMQLSACTWGNAYSWIERDQNKNPSAIWPIPASQVTPQHDDEGALWYEYRANGEKPEYIKPENMIHVHGMGSDGVQGYGVVARARQSIGLNLATEKYGASFFGEGATPRMVITHPEDLSKNAKRNIRQSWREIYGNRDNPHSVAVLDEGMKLEAMGLPPEDSQFLQTRQFQVVEIARWFRVPPHMLYDLSQSTFNNVEQLNMHFLTYTMVPWLERWRQELVRKLFNMADFELYYMDFDVSRLLMADSDTRWRVYTTGRNLGAFTLNQILKRERLPLLPAELGDTHVKPATMVTMEARDPSEPVDVDTINKLNALIESMAKGGIEMPATTAKEFIKATIPSASDSFADALINRWTVQKLVGMYDKSKLNA